MRIGPEWFVYAAALPLAGVAWLVRSRKRIELLNFIDPERVADRDGLARFAGNLLYPLAAFIAANGAAMHLGLLGDVGVAVAMTVGILVLTVWLLLGAQDHMKP